MDKQKIQSFLEDLAWSKHYIVWWLNYASNLDSAIWKSAQYLVAGADTQWIRVSDKHFTTKKYFYIDLDIRADIYQKDHRVIDDIELYKTIDVVIHEIKRIAPDFSYIVATGNWLHIYYVWKEQEFTKEEYSNAMAWIIKMFDEWLKELWFSVDEACTNIARLSRLPWSINDWKKIYDKAVAWDLWPREVKFLYYEPKESFYFNEIKSFIEVGKKEEEEDNLDDIIKTFSNPIQTVCTDWLDDYIRKVNDIELLPIACSYLWMTAWKERGDWIIPLQVFDGKYWNAWVYYHKPTNRIVAKWNKKLKKADWEWYNTRWFIKTELCNWDKDQAKRYIKDNYWIWWEEKKTISSVIRTIPTVKKEMLDFSYPWDVFWPFGSLSSWEFCLISSPTNAGKSTLANKIAEVNAKDYKVAYINLEFPIDEMLTIYYKRSIWCTDFNIKRKGSNKDPYTPEEEEGLARYLKKSKEKVNYFDMQQWTPIADIIELIWDLYSKWYRLFVVDSFSSIWSAKDDLKAQNEVISAFHEIVKKLSILIVWVHHFNKYSWKSSWSQKIEDLSNVVINITPKVDHNWCSYREIAIIKDKNFWEQKEIKVVFQNGEYDLYF